MFCPVSKRGKATAKAEGIAKGVCICHAISLSNEVGINGAETNLQKEAFVNPSHLRLLFSTLMSGTAM